MLLDILFIITVAFALYKGFTRGFVVGIFSLLAYLAGLAAALKLSSTVAAHLSEKYPDSSAWWPVLSFLVVFLVVVIVVNLIARVIRAALKAAALGWMDRIGGMITFLIIYSFIFSIFVFYATGLGWISDSVRQTSRVYPIVGPIAPVMVEFLGKILPVFENLFEILKSFFENLGAKFE